VALNRLLIVALGLFTSVCMAADGSISTARQPFLVFDGLLYQGKPNLGALGMTPIRGINPPGGVSKASDAADDAQVRATLQTLQGYSGAVYLDYEMWPTFQASPAAVSESIAKLGRVLQIAHEAVPTAKFGFYDVIPCWDYWGLVKNDAAKIKQWQDCNDRIAALAQHVDIVMPSLYTFYNDPQGWDVYAAALLQAARRYHKPVYAFLWPEFHVSNRFLKGKNLPGNFWRHELEFCRTRADGVVIWGGWQEQWDDNADWWVQTKGFLASLNSQ
jgi:hypothetical protein